MEEVLKSEIQEIKRPWQSWFLLGLFSMGLFSSFCSIIYQSNTKEIDYILYDLFSSSFVDILAFFVIISSLVSPLFFDFFAWNQYFNNLDVLVLFIFVVDLILFIGVFIRYRMAVLVVLIFYVLSILDFTIMAFIFSVRSADLFVLLGVILLLSFVVYLSISCLKHPFYNKKVN